MSDEELWYQQDAGEEAARIVSDIGGNLYERQGRGRMMLAEDSLALYLGSSRHSITGSSNPLALLDLVGSTDDSSAYNVIQAIADTKINATLRNKVRPMLLSEGGDSDLRAKVQAQQDVVDGQLEAFGLHAELGRAVCSNGYIFEAGGVEWTPDYANSRIICTPIFPWDYFVPQREARYGAPRQIFGRQVIARDVLLAFLANAPAAVRQAVESADSAQWDEVREDMRDPGGKLSDQIVIYKAWHLPSGRVNLDDPRSWGEGEGGRRVNPGHDGRHIVALSKMGDAPPLVDIPWPHDHFPQSWFKPNYVPGSYWSRGVPEILAGTQIELNRWNARIMQILNLHARPMVFVSKQAKLMASHITNALANIFEVNGSPQAAVYVATPNAVPPDLVRRGEQIAQSARDQLGMSEMSMTARKPDGVNHEPGMAYLADTETIRHTGEFGAWERFYISCSQNILRCISDLAKRDEAFELVFESDKALRRVKWKEIAVERDQYSVKTWPTNLFHQSPGQRADQVMDMVDRGWLGKSEGMRAIGAPDLDSIMGDQNAAEANIERKLDRIVAGTYGAQEMPTPFMDLTLARQLAVRRINALEANEESPEKLDRVMKFAEDVDALVAKMQPPASPPGAPGPGQAPAPSASIPNAPPVGAQAGPTG